MFKPEDPFPTPKDLLDTCHTFFSSCHTGEALIGHSRTGEGDDEGQIFEPRGRMERMLSGWVYRDLQVDHRFKGPSTIPGYYTRRTKIIRSSSTDHTIKKLASFGSETRPPGDAATLNREAAAIDTAKSLSAEDEQTGLEQEEEDQAEASPVDPVLPASWETQEGIKRHTKSRSRRQTAIIWMEWNIVYHPTYRIPSLCFNASREDGTVLNLQEILDYGILRPPTSTSVTSPDKLNPMDDHLPLSSDSPFPLVVRESHPSSSVQDLGVWAVHPCHVKPHVTELLLDDESHGRNGEEDAHEQQLAEDDKKMRKRWMEIWFMLHSRLLGDL